MGLFDFFKSKDDDESKIGIPSDERTSSFMRPLAFDEENNLFILEDKALAFAFQCLPLNGTSDGLPGAESKNFCKWSSRTTRSCSFACFGHRTLKWNLRITAS